MIGYSIQCWSSAVRFCGSHYHKEKNFPTTSALLRRGDVKNCTHFHWLRVSMGGTCRESPTHSLSLSCCSKLIGWLVYAAVQIILPGWRKSVGSLVVSTDSLCYLWSFSLDRLWNNIHSLSYDRSYSRLHHFVKINLPLQGAVGRGKPSCMVGETDTKHYKNVCMHRDNF